MENNQEQQKPESFERFEQAVKTILTVSKEEVLKREQEEKGKRKNGNQLRHS